VAGWAQAIDADLPLLARQAHSLRGLAGTLGLDALRGPAGQIEQMALAALADGTLDRARLQAAIDDLDQRLAVLLAAITAGLNGDPAPAADTVDKALDLHELKGLLHDSDSRALHWWQQYESRMRGQLSPVRARRVGVAMQRLDFDAALAALTEPGLTQRGDL
jgi:two-component system, sensor histidine kinase and response regulator